MRSARPQASLFFWPLVLTVGLGACGSVPIDDQRDDKRLLPARGVIRGTVSYSGPHPCSKDGHIVGNAILLAFDAKNPPPPAGLATSALNFVAVTGDSLFASEPREPSSTLYCPKDHGVTDTLYASAPFEIAPLDGGAYLIQAFFDTTGNFLPTFKFRNLPEAGDIGGGYIDVVDAAKHLSDPSYLPVFKTILVGVPIAGSAAPPQIPSFAIPSQGFVADNVTVTLGAPLLLPRPYFNPVGANAYDPNDAPILTMTQDHHVLAIPAMPAMASINAFQGSFASVVLAAGVPAAEVANATDPTLPFRLQIAPPPAGGLFVWTGAPSIPETAGAPVMVPQLWPQAVFERLADEPNPQGLTVQGSATQPLVIIQGITLSDDSLLATALAPPPSTPGPTSAKDHVTVLVRPTVLCLDPRNIDAGGVLVTPYFTGNSADPSEVPLSKNLFDPAAIMAANPLIRQIKQGCLPVGKYAINLIYPSGQAWTTPNEMGSCAPSEGNITTTGDPTSCGVQPRPVLRSQGRRAVIEIVPPTTVEGAALCASMFPVPTECLQNPSP